MSERQCPSCSQWLAAGRFGPLQLDLCPHCSGVWFDHGELTQVIAAGPAVVRRLCVKAPPTGVAATTRPVGPPACPACRAPLASVEYASMPGVRMEACRFCEGFWVNQATLLRIAATLEAAAHAPAPKAAQPAPSYGAPASSAPYAATAPTVPTGPQPARTVPSAAPSAAPPPAVHPATPHTGTRSVRRATGGVGLRAGGVPWLWRVQRAVRFALLGVREEPAWPRGGRLPTL